MVSPLWHWVAAVECVVPGPPTLEGQVFVSKGGHEVLYRGLCTRGSVQGVLYQGLCSRGFAQGVLLRGFSMRVSVQGVLLKGFCTRASAQGVLQLSPMEPLGWICHHSKSFKMCEA